MERIQGLGTSGLDIDALVKSSMKSYRIKIDTTQQRKDTVEIKQKQYRTMLTDTRSFYDKYLTASGSDSLMLSKNYSNVKFESSDSSTVKVNGLAAAKVDNYTVNVKETAKAAAVTLKLTDLAGLSNINVNGTNVDLTGVTTLDGLAKAITDAKVSGVTATNSQFSQGVVIQTTAMGLAQNINVTGSGLTKTAAGTDADVVITKLSNGEEYNFIGTSNQVVLDGVEFNFTGKTTGDVKVIGSKDVSSIKDKLVKFINDYNTMITKLNTAVNTVHDKNYSPLTEDQKSEMSEDQIKLWNEKVEAGQLNRDSDITRIANNMKSAMRSLVGNSGLTLEKIGIKPVKDNGGNLNGTFAINDEDLTKALEDNAEGVMNMFTKTPDSTAVTDSQKYAQTGLLGRIEDILAREVKTTGSALLKKAGLEGTSLVVNNTLTKSISDYEKKIADMQKALSKREQALYSKYAILETMLTNYSNQQSSLASMLGGQ